MKKLFKESKYFQDWLKKARRDFETAFLNHRHGGYTDVTCYFCHQVAEKSLKAYLLYKGIKSLPKTHILPSLLALCTEEEKSFSELKSDGEILDGYYIEAKYPPILSVDYSKKEAKGALDKAEKIFKFVSKKIKPEKIYTQLTGI